MMASDVVQYSLQELCQATDLSTATIIEIVEQGIIEPLGNKPDSWTFSVQMIVVTRKALRLHRDFGVEWSGIALAICLIDELEQLRDENKCLQRRLRKFAPD